MGIRFAPLIKIVPPNGPERVIDLTNDTACGPVQTEVGHTREVMERKNVLLQVRDYIWGYRRWAQFEFHVFDDMVDHDLIATIVNACDDLETQVFVSLDGTDEGYWRARLDAQDGYSGPSKFDDGPKWYAGAVYGLKFVAYDIIDAIPPVQGGSI